MKLLFRHINVSFVIAALIAIVLLPACNTSRYLQENQYLIKNVEINIDDKLEKVDKTALKSELNFLSDKKKMEVLFIPLEYIYIKTSEPGDSSKINNWIRTRFGKNLVYTIAPKPKNPPSPCSNICSTKRVLPGNCKSSNRAKKNQKAKITYLVNPGKRYKLGQLTYFSKDTTLLNHVLKSLKHPTLYPERAWTQTILNWKKRASSTTFKIRVMPILQPLHFCKGDSTAGNYTVDVILDILLPDGKLTHPVYRNGNVRVYTDHYHKQDTSDMFTMVVDSIQYRSEQSYFMVKPQVISNSIAFRPNELARRDDRLYTYNKLANLGAYRFAEIIPKKAKKTV